MSRDERDANQTEQSRSSNALIRSVNAGMGDGLPVEIMGDEYDDDDQTQSYSPGSPGYPPPTYPNQPAYQQPGQPYPGVSPVQSSYPAPAPYPSTTNTLQSQLDAVLSRVTRSSRVWNRRRLHKALKAARHVIARNYRQTGATVTADTIRTESRWRVKDYANRYGVTLPTNANLGHNDLTAFAGEICGAFSMPWRAFMPPQYQMALKLAEAGNPKAKQAVAQVDRKMALSASKAKAAAPAAESSDPLDTAGQFLYKLNPMYWLQSSERRKLKDVQEQQWTEHAKTQKEVQKQEETQAMAEEALKAKQAAAGAKARSAELQAQLKSIESQLSGDFVGKDASFVGRQELVGAAMLSTADTDDDMTPEAAAPVLAKVKKAQQLNTANKAEINSVCKKMQAGQGLNPTETAQLLTLLARNEKLHEFRKGLMSGSLYAKNPAHAQIRRSVILGTVKAMTPDEQKMLVQITRLAKQGNPNAIKALRSIKQRGYAMTTNNDNSYMLSAYRLATTPAWAPIDSSGKFLWWGGKKQSVEQVRLARMAAARKRMAAADARLKVADAQSAAEQRAAQAVADAATAEANAADAEAEAKEAAMQTAEAQYAPPAEPTPAADQSGAATLDSTNKSRRRAHIAKTNPRVSKLIEKSEEDSPTGVKLRAGLTMYKQSYSGDPKTRKQVRQATKIMIAKAKKGDKQAASDLNALMAARMITKAETRSARLVARQRLAELRKARVKAVQNRYEAAIANRLIRQSRKRELGKCARVERAHSAGNPKATAIIKHDVALAKAGDKAAQERVKAYQLARHVRKVAPTRAERRRVAQGGKLYRKAAHGNKKARRELGMLAAAEKAGNPNATRAMSRVRTGMAVEKTIAGTCVFLPVAATVGTVEARKKAKAHKHKKAQQTVAHVEAKEAAGKPVYREEKIAEAKAHKELGDTQKAGEAVAEANKLPSAKEELKVQARNSTAATMGVPAAASQIAEVQKGAEAGKPEDIATMGKILTVKNMDQVAKGKPVDAEMKEATKLVSSSNNGDEAATAKIAEIQKAATENPTPANVVKGIAVAGAGTALASLAANQPAKDQWLEANGVKPATPEPEKQDIKVVPVTTALAKVATQDLLPSLTAFLRSFALMVIHPVKTYQEGIASRQEVITDEATPMASSGSTTLVASSGEVDTTTPELAILQRAKAGDANALAYIKSILKQAKAGDPEAKIKYEALVKARSTASLRKIDASSLGDDLKQFMEEENQPARSVDAKIAEKVRQTREGAKKPNPFTSGSADEGTQLTAEQCKKIWNTAVKTKKITDDDLIAVIRCQERLNPNTDGSVIAEKIKAKMEDLKIKVVPAGQSKQSKQEEALMVHGEAPASTITKDQYEAILKEALKSKSVKKDDVLQVLKYQKAQNPKVDKKDLIKNIGQTFTKAGVKIV